MAQDYSASDELGGGAGSGDQMQDQGGGEQQQQSSGGGSFFIPKDVCGDKTYKPGDQITLEVVGSDDQGDLEVKMAGDEGGDWRSDLRTSLADKEGAQNG